MELFGTAGIRGGVDERVTPELALSVGRAAGQDGEEFVVGKDGRITSPALADAVVAGLESAGAHVVRVGQVPTPALAYASRGRRGVMVTASHNPPTDNGLKLFVDGQEYDDESEARVEERIGADLAPTSWDAWGDTLSEEVLPSYRAAVVGYARGFGADPTRLTVAVDCGTGMAGVATPQVIRAIGADVVSTEANVDGHFPARESKPTPETLGAFGRFVGDTTADLGVAHDGDADRIVVLDADGEVVHEDTVVAMLAEQYTSEATVDDPVVVTTPNASGRIDERVEAAGGRVERVRLGALHEGIARERRGAMSDTEVVFAAEPWKHVHPAFGGWIDGVVSAAVLTRLVAARGLDQRRAAITERPYRKVSVDCPDSHKPAVMATLESELPDTFPESEVATEHGVRLSFPDDSWALVRPSGTEPYVRIYAESESVDALVEDVRAVVESAIESAGR